MCEVAGAQVLFLVNALVSNPWTDSTRKGFKSFDGHVSHARVFFSAYFMYIICRLPPPTHLCLNAVSNQRRWRLMLPEAS